MIRKHRRQTVIVTINLCVLATGHSKGNSHGNKLQEALLVIHVVRVINFHG